MKNWLASLCLQRIVLPVALIAGAALRQNGLSSLYLILLLYNPAVPVPTSRTMSGHTGFYQKLVILFTIVNILSVFIFQIVLITYGPYGDLVQPNCGFLEQILRFVGLVRFDHLEIWNSVRIILPEVLILVVSIGVYWGCAWLNPAKTVDQRLLPVLTSDSQTSPSADSARKINLLTEFGKYVCLASLCVAGGLRPSVLSGFYYLVFLGAMTFWACNKPLGRSFAYFSRFLLGIVGTHIIFLYLYQMQWAQDVLTPGSPIPRYLGLTALVTTNCSDPRLSHLTYIEWPSYLNPFALVWLYFILWYESNMIIHAPASCVHYAEPTTSHHSYPNETTPLIRGGRGRESVYRRGGKRSLSDTVANISISEVPEDNSRLDNVAEEEDESGPGVLELFVSACITIGQLLAQSSYIATNIIMMAWSITYHSWLTFVLLLWAMVMWLMPNQRKAMLRTSPFLVLYAQLLLLANYIYCMDLPEVPDELPHVNLRDIGLVKITHMAIESIVVKSLYTVMFWITLKQYNQEKWEARNQSTLADIAAPLQIGVTTATGIESEAQTKTNQMIQKIGMIVRSIMTKFWIWVVAIILFTIGITGEKVTIFSIVYMALALIFIITFQLSWVLWRKMMYGFWLTVIIYSMLILILTYTYQFDQFSEYWTEYLHIDKEMQEDIGLKKFKAAELFVRLLTPTFFVIMTVIQLYYFHKDFLAISDIKSRGSSSVRPRVSQASSTLPSSALDPSTSSQRMSSIHPKHSFHFIQALYHMKVQMLISRLQELVSQGIELTWLFLELHMLKVIMFSVILLAILNVCAMHMIFVILAVIASTLSTKAQTVIAHIMSCLISLLLLAKMIYQIDNIKHDNWNVTCEHDNVTFVNNTAEWIGFAKNPRGRSLAYLLQGYIAIILVLTVHTVVVTRQKYQRHLRGRSLTRPYIMFPRISYKEVDKDIQNCVKFLFNYGFYRFGVEITLITVVTLIGTRMDFYALLYAMWLLLLVTPKRGFLSKLWPFFTTFIVISIPLQYATVIGLPPGLCIFYPWDSKGTETSEMMQRLQEWMYFPDRINPPSAYKLLCDFIVLMMVCRQGVVFRIERRHVDREYHGGTNKSIINEVEQPGFENPVKDFISHVRSWLDIVKRVVFSIFIWITLAIVFLAGTNRVNIFSFGYLIGAFVFLWQGNDFFLRPVKSILKWWNFLLTYNVTVILIKAALQILGCVFINEMPKDDSSCWFIQIFGVACVKKFTDAPPGSDTGDCSVPRGDVGLAWDGFCFGFLILQRRLFNSYYFCHIVDETKAMAILASRGAELIEELSQKQIREQQESERNILEKIKNKMDRIKASQQKIQGPSYKEPISHHQAIRSGDYYMFDDADEEELDLIMDEKSEEEVSDEDNAVDHQRTDVFELLSSALKTDIAQATEMSKRRTSVSPSLRKRSTSSLQSIAEEPVWKSCSSLPPSPKDETRPGPSYDDQPPGEQRSPGLEPPPDPEPDPDEPGECMQPDYGGEEGPPDQPSLLDKFITLVKFLWAFINSCMVTMTRYLNRFSRDYRYVMKTLTIEKQELKEKRDFGEGIRVGAAHVWQPLPVMPSASKHSPIQLDDIDEEQELSAADQPPIIRLVLAIWFAVISHSELVCYFTIFVHQIKSPTILSLPLPLMVFFWGTLTVPRPSKNFWVTIIAYTEVVVVIKCMFQFERIAWNQVAAPNNPFFLPRIIGIERIPGTYAYYDLLLLLIVFFHRSMLKSLGLWKSSYANMVRQANSTEGTTNSSKDNYLEKSNGGSDSHKSTTEFSDQQLIKAEEGKVVLCPAETPSSEKPLSHQSSDYCGQEMLPSLVERLARPFMRFFKQLLDPSLRVTADVYAYMFFCDFTNFLVVIFGFSSFGSNQGDSGVAEYFEENKVPVAFLVMLILQFGLIIIDRTLYLRKYILGKVIFQFILVIGIHVWMFFVLPAVTERSFNTATPPQIWYLVKCLYLLLSAYQIRSGYPTRILGNFLCKGYNYINLFLFKVFMTVPFVFELRALMDWIWTDTSMTLSDWLKMEDIFAHIFQLKCQRRAELEYPQARGEKKPSFHKYIVGGGCLVGIIAVIWFPLVLFALGNTVGKPNIPSDVTATVRLGAFQPIYKYTAQNNSIYSLKVNQWDQILDDYRRSPGAQTFLSNYEFDDVGIVKLSPHSTSIWTISPPDNETLIADIVNSTSPLTVKLELSITRAPTPENPGPVIFSHQILLDQGGPERVKLAEMLSGIENNVTFNYILPRFLKIHSRGAKVVPSLMSSKSQEPTNAYTGLNATLKHESNMFWWEMKGLCGYNSFIASLPLMDCNNSIVLYTFNDKAFPPTLSIISGKGIVGLYTTFVILIHSFIRQFFTGISFKIMFDDMPCVDRILQLCLDIYLVRESGELDLEEDLFAKLIFLYRSPETLIKWTRPPEESGDEEADNAPQ